MSRRPAGFDAVIFDLDGTLADTLADIAGSMNQALSEYGVPPIAVDRYKDLVCEGVFVLVELATPPELHSRRDEIVAAFRHHYRQNWVGTSRPYDGIPELLAVLDLPMAVLSNKPQEPVTAIVAALFGHVPFRCVYGQRPEVPHKPDPSVALSIAAELGVAPERCAFVGDTPIDIETALRARMLPIGAAWGFRPEAELRAAGARHVLRHPLELMTLLSRAMAALPKR